MPKNICAFGYFDLEGERSWVIRKGLTEAGFTVSLCRTEAAGFWPKIRDLLARWKELRASVDVLYVVFPGHYLMPLAWWLAKRKRIPLVLDIFISLYEADVEDRARLSPWHPKAWLLWCIDWLACVLAQGILIDTEEHRDYFVRHYGIAEEKFLVIPVGCRTDLFTPRENGSPPTTNYSLPTTNFPRELTTTNHPDRSFRVAFHGSYIPLHGIETILRAAKELQDSSVEFHLLGRGQTFPAMKKLADDLTLTNVRFFEPIPIEKLAEFIRGADVCLGIFGAGAKAQRVIPTKAFEIIACGLPLITARTPATLRVFRDRETALLVTPGNPYDLANAIRSLLANPSLAQTIAENGHHLFLQKFQPRTVVEPLVEWLL